MCYDIPSPLQAYFKMYINTRLTVAQEVELLSRRSVVHSLASAAYTSKYPWAKYWAPNCSWCCTSVYDCVNARSKEVSQLTMCEWWMQLCVVRLGKRYINTVNLPSTLIICVRCARFFYNESSVIFFKSLKCKSLKSTPPSFKIWNSRIYEYVIIFHFQGLAAGHVSCFTEKSILSVCAPKDSSPHNTSKFHCRSIKKNAFLRGGRLQYHSTYFQQLVKSQKLILCFIL